MKPVYANTFGIRKTNNAQGDTIEVTLDISHKYMETATTITNKGVENISTPGMDQVASIVMTVNNAVALRNLLNQTLGELTVEWKDGAAACVILASGGYPGSYEKGKPITLPAQWPEGVRCYHAGDRLENGQLLTSGGRVLGITATAPTLAQALDKAYAAAGLVQFEKQYMRHDIGQRALSAGKE